MNMLATHRVKNCENETVGFMIDNSYKCYCDVLQNISLIDNLTLDVNGGIKSKEGELPVRQSL